MSEQDAFAKLIARVQAGEEDAIGELIARYESHIRRVVRMRIGAQLHRVLDTTDVLQSVHMDLIRALRRGNYNVLSARQLVQLAAAIAKHKVLAQAAHWNRQRRRLNREIPLDAGASQAASQLAGKEASPSQHAAAHELNQLLEDALMPNEREVVAFRRQGLDNKEIARRLGKTPAAVRMILNRARHRLAAELGIDTDSVDDRA